MMYLTCSMLPIQIARALGLDPVEYEEVPMVDLNSHMKKVCSC